MTDAKKCRSCGAEKPVCEFYRIKGKPSPICKSCYIRRSREWIYADPERLLRNGHRVNARRFKHPAVSWANHFVIEEAHRLARLRTSVMGFKWSIDHIVPLKSALVCGLHTHTNIQVVPFSENARKRNRLWPDMP
jgi:hypothetical protein